jgi:hypothetical protein
MLCLLAAAETADAVESFRSSLFAWWNLVYVSAFFLALLYAMLIAVGLGGEGGDHDAGVDHGVDVGADHDLGLDVDHDVDVGVDHDVGVDVGHDADIGADHDLGVDHGIDHDVGADHDASVEHGVHTGGHASHTAAGVRMGGFAEALTFFGIGKVPLGFLAVTFLLVFAIVGWIGNAVLRDALRDPAAFFPITCAAALFCALATMKLFADTLGRYVKPLSSSAVRLRHLVGCTAQTVIPVDERFGQAILVDRRGVQVKVVCRVPAGRPSIAARERIVLQTLIPDPARPGRGHFLVEPASAPETT